MKKLTLVLFLLLLIPHFTSSQTGWVKIYRDDTTAIGIQSMKSIKMNGITAKQIYIQRGISFVDNPNQSGKYLKFNNTNGTWYNPANNYMNAWWCFCFQICNPPRYVCCQTFNFAVSPNDSTFIIKGIPSGCGIDGGDQTYITYNNGVSSANLSQFSNGFLGVQNFGYDIDPVNDNIIYFGYPIINTNTRCIFKSTNRGANWIAVDTNNSFTQGILKINPYNRTQIFVDGSQHLMMSTTSGTDFFNTDAPRIYDLVFDPVDSSIYGRGTGIYKSTNHGFNWAQVANGDYRSIEISSVNHNILYAGSPIGLYRSDNGGQIWNLYNDSFTPSKNVIGLSMDQLSGDTVYAATQDAVYKVWGMYVGIRNTSSTVPETYSLEQNYPNPFNPSTNIKFNIPEGNGRDRTIHLIIYDVLGKEVKALVNESLKPGSYEIDWNASNYPSGVYYYSLSAGDFNETKKMVLIK